MAKTTLKPGAYGGAGGGGGGGGGGGEGKGEGGGGGGGEGEGGGRGGGGGRGWWRRPSKWLWRPWNWLARTSLKCGALGGAGGDGDGDGRGGGGGRGAGDGGGGGGGEGGRNMPGGARGVTISRREWVALWLARPSSSSTIISTISPQQPESLASLHWPDHSSCHCLATSRSHAAHRAHADGSPAAAFLVPSLRSSSAPSRPCFSIGTGPVMPPPPPKSGMIASDSVAARC